MRDATLTIVVFLPTPWPVAVDSLVTRQIQDGVSIQLYFTRTGRIAAIVTSNDGLEQIKTETPEIRINGEGVAPAIIMLALSIDGAINFVINGTEVSSTDEIIALEAGPDPRNVTPVSTTIDKAGIKAEYSRRAQRVLSLKKDGLTDAKITQRWNDFVRECRLLDKAVTRLRAGDEDEVVNVSNHLRKLIGGGNGNHVLQDCAALDATSLLVWTVPPLDPQLWTPIQMGAENLTYWSSDPFVSAPIGIYTQQTDLDCWLSRDAGVIAGKKMTNLTKLHSIADKIGAHLDLRHREVTDMLEEMRIGTVSALAEYLIVLSMGVLTLANELLVKHK